MPEKSISGIGIFSGIQQSQSGIRVNLIPFVTDESGIDQLCC
jgi:hypothetical protein